MGNLSVGDDYQPVQYAPPRPPAVNPGPPPRGDYSGGRNGSAHPSPPPQPPPDIFGGYLGPQVDEAKQLVHQWLSLMGYPPGLDANSLTLDILGNGLTSNQNSAYQWLFDNRASSEQQDSHAWAQFGLDANTYQSRKDSLDSLFSGMIGQDPAFVKDAGGDSLQSIYYQALKGNWGQTQILQALTSSSSDQAKQLLVAQPWLAQGQTFQQASQNFTSLYGTAPVDTQALAGWFRFNSGAATLGRQSRATIESAAPLAQAATESR